ncbi:hypothetical protein RB628_12355 [Streptomyces sp. ADMS]|uniref:hypothetical protein n=1 Tax=Streptomyces sp. ADMS TaxID=3071415 RepID=UPI00296EF5A5|nr:hypothetical protein [Streptomyces sp. ADMS]MDW4906109.1 hypothetical protein [Streptomyces sp. ADMS]
MGALARIRHRPRGRRRAVAVAGLVVAVVGGVVACDPGGLGSATVAFTTDQTVTKELERRDVNVQWLTCTASVDTGNVNEASGSGSSPSASEKAVADVDCRGKTTDGGDITVTGKVTRAVDGRCVRGDLTAKVDGKQWFRVTGLGNCDAPSTPARTPPATWQPPDNERPGPTVTVTVTKTIWWCRQDPNCLPVEGK